MTVNLVKAPTYTEALVLLDAIVDERGADYVYPPGACIYVNANGAPMCGVGLALVRHGVDPGLLRDNTSAQRLLNWVLWPHHLTGGVDESVVALFQRFQTHQDERHTWGASRDIAVEYAEGFYGLGVA